MGTIIQKKKKYSFYWRCKYCKLVNDWKDKNCSRCGSPRGKGFLKRIDEIVLSKYYPETHTYSGTHSLSWFWALLLILFIIAPVFSYNCSIQNTGHYGQKWIEKEWIEGHWDNISAIEWVPFLIRLNVSYSSRIIENGWYPNVKDVANTTITFKNISISNNQFIEWSMTYGKIARISNSSTLIKCYLVAFVNSQEYYCYSSNWDWGTSRISLGDFLPFQTKSVDVFVMKKMRPFYDNPFSLMAFGYEKTAYEEGNAKYGRNASSRWIEGHWVEGHWVN